MTCQQAEPLLARAADGTLDADRSAALALHLDACADCRDALDAQRAMRHLLVARPETPVPLGFATRVMANLPDTGRTTWARAVSGPAAGSGWLETLNWRAWTLRLAPVAGALFVGAALGLGPSTEAAETGASDYSDVVTAWMVEEATDGEVRDPGPADSLSRFWEDTGETTEDPLIDILLAPDPQGTFSGTSEAGR